MTTCEMERRLRLATGAKVRRDFHQVNVARLRRQLLVEEEALSSAEEAYRAAEAVADATCIPNEVG